ncbi:MAG: PHP domain-containing protein [Dehalococcoidia bacterium]
MKLFDLHVHTRPGSGDSSIEYEDLVAWARKAGLDGICITEHGMEKTGVAERLSREYDFVVLEGLETGTEYGDILVFGVDSIPRICYRAADLCRFVAENGGVSFAAHPFRSEISRPIMMRSTPRVTLEEAMARPLFKMVDGVEAANGWSAEEDVAFCLELCQRLGLKTIGASDAHMPRQIGSCATVFQNGVYSEEDLVRELRLGNYTARDCRTPEMKVPTFWFSSP